MVFRPIQVTWPKEIFMLRLISLPYLPLSSSHWPLRCLRAQSCLTLGPYGLWPTRLLCPWDFPGRTTGVGCHFAALCCFSNRPDMSPSWAPAVPSVRNTLPLNTTVVAASLPSCLCSDVISYKALGLPFQIATSPDTAFPFSLLDFHHETFLRVFISFISPDTCTGVEAQWRPGFFLLLTSVFPATRRVPSTAACT